MTGWHADTATLLAYANGGLPDTRSSSLEAHLLACEVCRDGLGAARTAPSLDRTWLAIVDAIDAPRPRAVERVLRLVGVPGHIGRLIATTPSLRGSWLLAESIALGFGVVAANAASGQAASAGFLFLTIAALLPVAGVAVAFGPGVDPAYEIGVAAPMRGDRLLLIRASAVLAASVAITAIAAVAMPGLDASAVAWLVPSLGLTLTTLALGTWLRPAVAASCVAVAWVAVSAITASASDDRFAAFRPAAQLACLATVAVSAVVLLRRHSAFEEGTLV